MSTPRLFRVNVLWEGKGPRGGYRDTFDVMATDACEVVSDHVLPGSYRIGEYDSCEISISPLPLPPVTEDSPK